MKIKKPSILSKYKITLIITGVALCLISTGLLLEMTGVTHIFSSSKNQSTGTGGMTDDSKNKKSLIENASKKANVPNSPSSDDITLSSRQETDGSVTILTQLKNYSDGTCSLIIKNGKEEYTQSAPVLYQNSYSTCAGFSVPFGTIAPGNWQVTLSVVSKGKTNTNTISVEVK